MVVALVGLVVVPVAGATTANPFLEATGSLSQARTQAAAVALADGRVLVAGGCHYSHPKQHEGCTIATAELYDPEEGTFSPTGSMAYGRVYAAAAPLPGGKALIVGGTNSEGTTPAITTAEIFDPESETFSLTGSPLVERWGAAAAPLPDGRVLVAGGGPGLKSAEIYDPESGTFSATGSMANEHHAGMAAPLPDGRVLVAGGWGGGGSAEIFDPVTETFSSTGSMIGEAAVLAFGAALADGSVLAFGDAGYTGFKAPRVFSLQQFDPGTEAFSPYSLTSPRRRAMAIAQLPGGRLLLAGGSGDEPEAWLGHDIVPTTEILVSAPSPRSDGLAYGTVPVSETSGPEALTVTNLGAQALEVEAASLTGANAADFEIVEDECTSETLGFEESCELLISVTPTAEEPLSAAVQLTSNAPASPHSFPLAANAEEAPTLQSTAPGDSQPDEDAPAVPQSGSGSATPPASTDSPGPSAAPAPAVAPRTQRLKRPCRRAAKRSATRCSRTPVKRHRVHARHAS